MTDILKLVKELYPDTELLTLEQVRQLMADHARLPNMSGRKAAEEVGVSATYWHSAVTGGQLPGDKIVQGYHLEKIVMYRVTEE